MFTDEHQHIFLNHIPLLLLTHDGNWIPSCIVESIAQDFDVSFKQGTQTISPERLAETCPDSFETEIPSENKVLRWRRIPCKVYRAAYYGEDITQERHWKKRAAETRLLHPLTRLPNLTYTLKKLAAWNRKEEICAIRIGLVNLAVLNELYSEQCGNEAIRRIAATLKEKTCRPDLFLGQLSGNQFLMAGTLAEPEAFVNELYHQLTEPLRLPDGHLFHPRIEVGWMRKFDLSNPAKTIEHLHLAQKISTHTQRPAELKAEWVREHERKMSLEMALRNALIHGQFELYFQPKFDARHQRVDSCEALIRWHHPKEGFVSPLDFIPLAEKSGLIVQIGEWVLDQALGTFKQWLKHHPYLSHISVNVSPVQLLNPGFPDQVLQLLEKHQLAPHYLELELTESGFLQNHEEIIQPIMTLGQMEVRWAIDDFGTGYSSLARLKELPFSRLKIDRAFIRHIDQDPEDRHLTSAIVQMAEALGLDVVAEGVEGEEQKEILTQQGCMEHQGYFYGKPMSAESFQELLKQSA